MAEKSLFDFRELSRSLPTSNVANSRENVRFRDHVSERTISSAASTATQLDVASSSNSRRSLRAGTESNSMTSSRTREELVRREAHLTKLKRENGRPETSSRTRERLAMIEQEIEAVERKKTSSRTREELARKEEMLNKIKAESAIRSVTRDRMSAVDRAIKEEKRRSKEMRASAESAIVIKGRELDKLKEVNARKEVIKQVMRNIARAQITDLVFLLDCTGSMCGYINTVKDEIQQMVENIKDQFPDATLNVAFVGYRDHLDDKRIETLPFTTDYDRFSSFLGTIIANGGGDTAEDVFGGLETAATLSWKSPCRVLMHFGDAPCHGNRFHDGVMDDDSGMNTADRRGLRIENLLTILKQLDVRYFFGQINSSTDKMIRVFREVSGDPAFPFMVNASDTSKVSSAISESVCSSIAASVDIVTKIAMRKPAFKRSNLGSIEESTMVHHASSRSLKSYTTVVDEPDWSNLPIYTVESINGKQPLSFCNMEDELTTDVHERSLKIAPHPFSEGGQRISYKGLDCSASLSTPKIKVLKEFKHTGDSYKDYLSILETHIMAEFLAKEFNKVHSSPRICYLRVNIVRFKDTHGGLKLYTCESLLENYKWGFEKWTNNTSFVNKTSYSDTIQAFSHWTYEKTNGYLMICDLQGVQVNSDRFVLTDPAMHCTDVLRFGTTNLGSDGMKKYFRTHKCNEVCRKLGLKQRK